MSNFDKAFDRLFAHEGEWTNDPRDRGNWTSGKVNEGECKGTKYGISAASYPNIDIRGLTVTGAREIYKRDFWDSLGLTSVPSVLVFQLFDSAVNHGIHATKRILQRGLALKDDGVIGPITQKALTSTDPNDICYRFLAERLAYMTGASTWEVYGKGWARRIGANLKHAAEDN